MKISRSVELEDILHNKIKDNWDHTEREGIHLSDLLTPRKSFWRKTNPKPLEIEDILYFISGLGIEEKLTSLLGERHVRTRNKNSIFYSPDLSLNFGPDYGVLLCEVKSRRKNIPEIGQEEKEFDYYLQQLGGYLALDHKNHGALIVLSLAERVDETRKTVPVLAVYDVEYNKKELKEIRKNLTEVKELLEEQLKEPRELYFNMLPKCPSWMCGRSIKTMTKPPRCNTCNKDFSTDWGISKHKDSPKTSDHEVTFGEYEYGFDPRCSWYKECLGDNN
jgi:hypothetical protein